MKKRLLLVLLVPVCLMAAAVAALRMLWAIVFSPDRAWLLAIAHDQLANVAFNGNDGETISSRANRARNEKKPWGCVLCKLLDYIQENHCINSAGV